LLVSLKNHGVDEEADAMFEMGAETMRLPMEEKMKYEQGDSGMSFGYAWRSYANRHSSDHITLLRYKAAGANAVDETGALDTVEFINVAKNDALAWPGKVHRDYPSTVNARMESTIKPFIQKSADINMTILGVFNERLGLPKGALASKHQMDAPSGCESRVIKNPPRKDSTAQPKQAIGAHCDFGSLVRQLLFIQWRVHVISNCFGCSRSFITDWADCKSFRLDRTIGSMSRYVACSTPF
jgi:isopenicillin N synthase-like dioxygenase